MNNGNNNNNNGGGGGEQQPNQPNGGGLYDFDEQERLSFEDSDRFEEDSLCSWISEPESVVNNWRGWRKQSSFIGRFPLSRHLDKDGSVLSLTELSAREVASSIPFEAVERVFPPVPEPLQLRIAFYRYVCSILMILIDIVILLLPIRKRNSLALAFFLKKFT